MTNTSSNFPLVQVQNMSMSFDTNIYQNSSWKEVLIRFLSNPLAIIRKKVNKLEVLKDISFTASKGERIGIIGANGTGKTTLCRSIAGIYGPSSGGITTQGNIRAVFDTAIGMQSELTGLENARLLLEFFYSNREVSSEKLKEAMDFSELGDFLKMPFKTYSAGMKARLCLSLVSAAPADILILDEVFNGADQKFSKKISERIVGIIDQSGIVFFISHVEDQIRAVCNRVILLDGGKIVHDGAVEEGLKIYSEMTLGVHNSESKKVEKRRSERLLSERNERAVDFLEHFFQPGSLEVVESLRGEKSVHDRWNFEKRRDFLGGVEKVYQIETAVKVIRAMYEFDVPKRDIDWFLSTYGGGNILHDTDGFFDKIYSAIDTVGQRIRDEICSDFHAIGVGFLPLPQENGNAGRICFFGNESGLVMGLDCLPHDILDPLKKNSNLARVVSGISETDTELLNHKRVQDCWQEFRDEFSDISNIYPEVQELVALIDELLGLESRAYSWTELLQIRNTLSTQVVRKIKSWLTTKKQGLATVSILGERIDWVLSRWDNLIYFLRDLTVPLTNKYVEFAKERVLMKLRCLDAISHLGVQRALTVYSILYTCKIHNLNFQGYLCGLAQAAQSKSPLKTPMEFSSHRASV